MNSQRNPLLASPELPPFSLISFDHLEPAARQAIADNEQALTVLLDRCSRALEPDWQLLLRGLEEIEDRLANIWSVASHLHLVNNTEPLRQVYDRCQPLVIEFNTRLSQNPRLCGLLKQLAATEYFATALSQAQRKVVEDYLLEFRLAGADLSPEKQLRFKELEQQISKLSNRFSTNVLDSTHAWSRHLTDSNALLGLPALSIEHAADAARQRNLDGYLLTLDFPSFNAVMTYADDRELRREVYRAYFTRASDQAEQFRQWNNSGVILEILELRREIATLLGYDSFAALSLAKKMAESPDKVMDFLSQLAARGLPVAKHEVQELQEFAASQGQDHLEAWDIAYYSEKLRIKRFDVSQEELRAYFPLERVKTGLFSIISLLFDVEITSAHNYDTWHPLVEVYEVRRKGKLLARLFLDLFTRKGKQGGAWMDICRSRRVLPSGRLQLPAAYLICNFQAGNATTPALLTHSEVTTLFHEFGHGLHHILTGEQDLRISGLNGVAWDAVELPSQLLENWCWDPQSLQLISGHFETGQPLPGEMLQKMLASRNFQSGMKMMRQLEFGMFDFRLHLHLDRLHPDFVRETLTAVRDLTAVYAIPEFNRSENTFSHIFSGGYAAGYYSYYWAEVLSADVFSRFEEYGVLNPRIGRKFLNTVLARGGSRRAAELFVDFMGREPQVDALLRQKGMVF